MLCDEIVILKIVRYTTNIDNVEEMKICIWRTEEDQTARQKRCTSKTILQILKIITKEQEIVQDGNLEEKDQFSSFNEKIRKVTAKMNFGLCWNTKLG